MLNWCTCCHVIGIDGFLFFFFNDTATTEIYTLSLHDALPFSPLTTVRSGVSSRFSPGRIALTASRPGCPTTSATNRIRNSSELTGQLSAKTKREPDCRAPLG